MLPHVSLAHRAHHGLLQPLHAAVLVKAVEAYQVNYLIPHHNIVQTYWALYLFTRVRGLRKHIKFLFGQARLTGLHPSGLTQPHWIIYPDGDLSVLYSQYHIQEILGWKMMDVPGIGDQIAMVLNSEISRYALTSMVLLPVLT